MNGQFDSYIDEILGRIIEIRHDIHQHPETAYNETRTAGVIEAFLDESGIPHKRYAGTGVVGTIGKPGGRTVGLRSEMDALPTDDLSGLPWASEYPGFAHACGHDGHIANLLGTAYILKQIEPELAGSVACIWQPAEEGGAGAAKMIADGLLDDIPLEAVFAIHGWPGLDVGNVGCRFGSAMASVDNFEVSVKGKSAHAALPNDGIDPIVIAAQIVNGYQHVRARMFDPLTPFVVSTTTIHGGTAYNIIPESVEMTGTIRTLDPETRKKVPELLERMTVKTADASGGEAAFTLVEGYPPTINEVKATAFAKEAIAAEIGESNVVEIMQPVMGGEDFSYFLEKIPGSFLRLGVGNTPSLHNSHYDFNDKAIPTGIKALSSIAKAYLDQKG